jgi:hypothetical protein
MSEENVEIVRRFYRAWAGDEFPGPIELMDPEIEYINPAGAVEREPDGPYWVRRRG